MLNLLYFLFGGLGSLAKDLIEDNKITMPKKSGSDICLGFLGGMLVGGLAAIAVDGSIITAVAVGYAGTSILPKLLPDILTKTETEKKVEPAVTTEINENIEELIKEIAQKEGVDADLAIKVAKCESGLKPKAVHINQEGSKDRGLYQINDKYHPEVTDEQAFDPVFSIKFFCTAYKAGNLSWWNASKSCWNK